DGVHSDGPLTRFLPIVGFKPCNLSSLTGLEVKQFFSTSGRGRSIFLDIPLYRSPVGAQVPVSLSLCEIPMPSRTTRQTTRPRASDRSMVDTVQPHGLPVSESDRRRHH